MIGVDVFRKLVPCLLLFGYAIAGEHLLGADFVHLLVWWTVLLLLGLGFLPLTRQLFPSFFDLGYPFSKVIGLVVFAYLSWLASSLRILPFSLGTLLACLVLIAASLAGVYWRRDLVRDDLWKRRKVFVLEELLFLALLSFWVYLRGLYPDIQGLEKFMDYGFGAAVSRADYMPPTDLWLAGETINYYYFGHYLFAVLSTLTRIPLSVAYNLMAATLPGLCFCLSLSLTANLVYALKKPTWKQSLLGGLVSATLLTFGGNLHPFIYGHLLPGLERADLYHGEYKSEVQSRTGKYWYADATRYVGHTIPEEYPTIHEFPAYSFTVADLHGHVSNIPYVLTLLALLTGMILKAYPKRGRVFALLWPGLLVQILATGFLLAIFQMTNTWDVVIYLVAVGMACLCRNLLALRSVLKGVAATVLHLTAVVTSWWMMTLPFTSRFEAHYSSFGWVHTRTPPQQFLVLWGVPLFFAVLYLGDRLTLARPTLQSVRFYELLRHFPSWLERIPRPDLVALLWTFLGLFLLIVPEVVYLQDIYAPSHYRANTYFKVTYQAFLVFGVLAGYFVFRIFSFPRSRRIAFILEPICILALLLPLTYPRFAVSGYYGSLSYSNFDGLDGLAFLTQKAPGDARAIRWLNEYVEGVPVILEANGDSYSDYGRVSMATGLPTVLGWYVHEWLWRGDTIEINDRVMDISIVYESKDEGSTRDILGKYRVQYVVLGELERKKFPRIQEAKLRRLGRVVSDHAGTLLIQMEPE